MYYISAAIALSALLGGLEASVEKSSGRTTELKMLRGHWSFFPWRVLCPLYREMFSLRNRRLCSMMCMMWACGGLFSSAKVPPVGRSQEFRVGALYFTRVCLGTVLYPRRNDLKIIMKKRRESVNLVNTGNNIYRGKDRRPKGERLTLGSCLSRVRPLFFLCVINHIYIYILVYIYTYI